MGLILVEILFFRFLTQNWFLISRVQFWTKNYIFDFSTKVLIWDLWELILGKFLWKNLTLYFWPPGSNFDRKIKLWIFRPKIDLGPLRSIFGAILVEKSNFQFFDKNWFLTFRVHFWSRYLKSNYRFFDQKSIVDLQCPFFVEKFIH